MSTQERRLVIGMLNTAGQGKAWAHALTRFTSAAAESWAITRPQEQAIQFPSDRTYPLSNGAADQAWLDLLNAQSKPTHLIIESSKPISIKGTVRRMLFQAATARRHGIAPALLFHGSDIRVPSLHRATHAESPFHQSHDGLTEILERKTTEMRRWMTLWPFPIFISTIDLRRFVLRGRWLPVVVGDHWFTAAQPIGVERARPRVLHLPSRRELFQSDHVDQICTRLHDEGLIEYRSVTGVPPAEVRQLVEWSDIVIDKIGLRVTGVMGAEVMASGRLLIGDVDQIVRDELPDLPLIQSSVATLDSVIRDLVADRSTWAARVAAGHAFARKYHDGRYSAAVLAKWMGVPVNQP
jgi:hypothetical protein